MKFTADEDPRLNTISGYGVDGIQVKGNHYPAGLVLTNSQILPDWGVRELVDLDKSKLLQIVELQPEFIVLGTGRRQIFPAGWVYALLAETRIGLEVMDTAAACRTYNVLVMEGRNVAAALLPILPG